MAKIGPADRKSVIRPGAQRAAHRPTPAGSPAEAPAVGVPAHITPLVDTLDSAGSMLQHDPTGQHLENYKLAVRRFLDAVLEASMQVNSEATFGLSQKAFSTITRIDVSLADLTDAVLGRQQDVLKIRSILDQIKGLIVDLYR